MARFRGEGWVCAGVRFTLDPTERTRPARWRGISALAQVANWDGLTLSRYPGVARYGIRTTVKPSLRVLVSGGTPLQDGVCRRDRGGVVAECSKERQAALAALSCVLELARTRSGRGSSQRQEQWASPVQGRDQDA